MGGSIGEGDSAAAVPAAEYIRMSTEHQQYSTENQAEAIRDYAQRRGFRIVRTYADAGKSGLRIQGRDALRQLIEQVQSGQTDFEAVLVYDVSRWGRFQDSDESAYYEYICRQAGIGVYYCAEQFENDGSPSSTIIKSVKRAMAGEYSRELSAKVFKGQCKLIELGYRQGGPAGYGLRRMRVDQNGEPKGILAPGEHKSLQTDRVILVPGPDEEVAIVRRIYRMFTHEGLTERAIAQWLNDQRVPSESGRPWTAGVVRQILSNEKYIGHNVYNRVSFKLKKKRVRNPPEMWVRHEEAFTPIVDVESFFVARGIIVERNRVFSDEEMLQLLQRLYEREGTLGAGLIDAAEGMPSASAYRHRFGSLIQAYRQVGYAPERDYSYLEINKGLRQLHPELLRDVIRRLEAAGAAVDANPRDGTLSVNGEFTVSVVLSRYRQTPAGSPRWLIRFREAQPPDITLMVRMDESNRLPTDYYLLPHMDLPAPRLQTGLRNGAEVDAYRFESLAFFMDLAVRERIEDAA